MHLSTSPSFLELGGIFLSHPYVHTVEGFALIGKIYGSLYNHELYDVGKSIADTMFSIFGNDELLDYLIRVKEIERQDKIDAQLKIAKAKREAEEQERFWEDSIDLSPEGERRYELEREEKVPGQKERRLENEAFEAAVHKRDLERQAQWAAEKEAEDRKAAATEARLQKRQRGIEAYWAARRW